MCVCKSEIKSKYIFHYFCLFFSAIPPTDMTAAVAANKMSTSNSVGLRQVSTESVERMMIPPCVRIEGCTPPSDSSVDADLDQCN